MRGNHILVLFHKMYANFAFGILTLPVTPRKPKHRGLQKEINSSSSSIFIFLLAPKLPWVYHAPHLLQTMFLFSQTEDRERTSLLLLSRGNLEAISAASNAIDRLMVSSRDTDPTGGMTVLNQFLGAPHANDLSNGWGDHASDDEYGGPEVPKSTFRIIWPDDGFSVSQQPLTHSICKTFEPLNSI